ncbi:chromate transporter [Paenibacillus sp. J5C_2022]|uniref:chromate transporter n=1 Tax=Paenibacillus sp. J5C2022 TaxID=2977129 RepID=UPI0021D19C86|nr:chromate transporter [Paenibacillus sp. J5C2022]MCU6707367.1 chromate transporter [Paenibacillus sp. J5C2022]
MSGLIKLLLVFLQIGLLSIGGGYAIIPFIQELVVERYAWVAQREFTDLITISQMTPGPLAVNTATFVGSHIAGIPGAIIATFGCVISGICISIFMYRFFQRFNKSIYVLDTLNGLKSASLGLIMSATVKILLLTLIGASTISVAARVDWFAIVIFTGSLIALRKWRMNPILLMVLTGIWGGFRLLAGTGPTALYW